MSRAVSNGVLAKKLEKNEVLDRIEVWETSTRCKGVDLPRSDILVSTTNVWAVVS